MQQSLEGRVALVTGASFGIGKQAAIGLAELGATVVGVAGERGRAAVVKQEIRRVSDRRDVEVLTADMASLGDIHGLAEEFSRRFGRLHVLVNSAGGMFREHELTADGVERTFAVNYLSTFLVTNLLADLLRASTPARIVNACRRVHRHGHLDFDDLQGEQDYRPAKAYTQAQLARVVFTYELASRLDGSGITVNGVELGTIDPLLDSRPAGTPRLATAARRPFPPAGRAARGVVRVATDAALEGISAEFFNRAGAQARTSRESYDPALASQLWKVSEQLTGLVVP